MLCDAHLHLSETAQNQTEIYSFFKKLLSQTDFYRACTCAHDKTEFELQQKLIDNFKKDDFFSNKLIFYSSFGMHPQLPLIKNADFMEQLLIQNKIDAIGEAGFDLFTQDFKQTFKTQETAWQIELELASFYKKPLVVHERKATNIVFEYTKQLKKLPAVLFHSFPGSLVEAKSLLNHGINAFFSFGKQVLNNNKKVIDCASNLPISNLLLETDAPYQTLKGEKITFPEEISRVYNEVIKLRNLENLQSADFQKKLESNFINLFGNK